MKFSILCSQKDMNHKPTGYEVGAIQEELKQATTEEVTIYELMERLTNGRTVRLGSYKQELTPNQRYELEITPPNERKPLFERYINTNPQTLIQTQLIAVDVDNVTGESNPVQIAEETGALAMYYTFSHNRLHSVLNTKEHRFRLFYLLDAPLKSDEEIRIFQSYMKDQLISQYTAELSPIKVNGEQINEIDVIGSGILYGTNNKDYFINDSPKTYGTSFVSHVKEMKHLERIKRQLSQYDQGYSFSDNEYMAMAKHIGNTNGELNYNDWVNLMLGVWHAYHHNIIDQSTALGITLILDGNEHSQEHYLKLFDHPSDDVANPRTIASFVKYALDKGYTRRINGMAQALDVVNNDNVHHITIDQYLEATQVYSLFKNEHKKLLVEAPTGTGKTTAIIKASQWITQKDPNAFVYFASPTRALSQQIAKQFDLGKPMLGSINVRRVVDQAIAVGSRVMVGTYDKTPKVADSLRSNMKLYLIMDECHQEIYAYSFRRKAIRNLFETTYTKFIGLSATIQEIDKDSYDAVYVAERKEPKTTASNLNVLTYHRHNEYKSVLLKLITKHHEQGRRVLAFVDNVEVLEMVRQALKKEDITASIVSSSNNQSATFRAITQQEQFPDGVDVILATQAIADGINIRNRPEDVCIMLPVMNDAPFFNLSLIEQASNRFRNQYQELIIPVYVNKEARYNKENEKKVRKEWLEKLGQEWPGDYRINSKLFGFEWYYDLLLTEAQAVAKYTREHFKGHYELYAPSFAETIAGLRKDLLASPEDIKRAYQAKHDQRLGKKVAKNDIELLEAYESYMFSVDHRAIRMLTSQQQERYYTYRPYAFINALRKVFERGAKVWQFNEFDADSYLIGIDAKDSTEEIERLEEIAKESDKDKKENYMAYITKKRINDAMSSYRNHDMTVREDDEPWKALKKVACKPHYTALKSLLTFMTDYGDVMHELENISRNNEARLMERHFEALETVERYKEGKDMQPKTKLMLRELASALHGATAMHPDDVKEIISTLAQTKFKGATDKRTLERIEKDFFVRVDKYRIHNMENRRVWVYDYELISINAVMLHHQLDEHSFERLYEAYFYNKMLKKGLKTGYKRA